MIYVANILLIVFAIILRILLTIGVNKECDVRQTNSKVLWTILTAIIGFISAVTFACFVPKKEKMHKENKIILALYSIILVGTILFASLFAIPTNLNQDNNPGSDFNWDAVTYKNDYGVEVAYDKMGFEYTAEEYYNSFKWYDEKGNSYVYVYSEEELFPDIKCIETDEIYSSSDYTFLVNEQGYLCIFDDTVYDIMSIHEVNEDMSQSVWFDKNRNLYYYTSDIFYDESGNIVFSKNSGFENFDKSEIKDEELEYIT